MNRFKKLYSSSIGKKFIAAVTGVILFGFLIGHVAGNLKVFTGSSTHVVDGEEQYVPHIDEYGQFLKEAGTPILPEQVGLWIARSVLLVALILHVVVVIQLSLQSKAARPVGYVKSKKSAASLSSLYMMFSGLLILGFIIFHILHFTTGTIQLGTFEHGYVYNNLSHSFSKWPVAIGYVIVMVVLAFHLYHGVWSLFQTLGLDNPDRNKALRTVAATFAIVLAIGFAAVPLSFMTGSMPETVEYVRTLLTDH
jgi:succinate dehydrogenase / fumarate reductase cytochrome b subunit